MSEEALKAEIDRINRSSMARRENRDALLKEVIRLRAINADLVEALRDIEVCDIYGPVGIAVLKTKARVAINKAERGNSNE